MKLIVEKIAKRVYIYFEDEEHHQKVENNRDGEKLDLTEVQRLLDIECDMSHFPDNSYFVVDMYE